MTSEKPYILGKNDLVLTSKTGYWQDQRIFWVWMAREVFQACILILGVSDAVFVFTKEVKPVTKYLHSHGFKVIICIDIFY